MLNRSMDRHSSSNLYCSVTEVFFFLFALCCFGISREKPASPHPGNSTVSRYSITQRSVVSKLKELTHTRHVIFHSTLHITFNRNGSKIGVQMKSESC